MCVAKKRTRRTHGLLSQYTMLQYTILSLVKQRGGQKRRLRHYHRTENIKDILLHLFHPHPASILFLFLCRPPAPPSSTTPAPVILSVATLHISFWSMSSPENLAEFSRNAQRPLHKSLLKSSATSSSFCFSLCLRFSPLQKHSVTLSFNLRPLPCFF